MKKIIVEKKYNGLNIYDTILKVFPNISKALLNKTFRLKDIKTNGVRVDKKHILSAGDSVEIYIPDHLINNVPKDIFYAYEDDNILVAYKPRGVVSCKTGDENSSSLYFDEIVKSHKDNEGLKICHRLDTNTEGLVIFSKNKIAHESILLGFKSRYITKKYVAVVAGKLPKDHDILSHYMIKDMKTGYSKITEKNIKGSVNVVTEYKVLKYMQSEDVSILDVQLHTGKTHQIRAHMKFLGTPIIGDSKYATNEINRKFKLKSQMLYAYKYNFNFEKTSPLYYLNKVEINIYDTVIKDIERLLAYLNKN